MKGMEGEDKDFKATPAYQSALLNHPVPSKHAILNTARVAWPMAACPKASGIRAELN